MINHGEAKQLLLDDAREFDGAILERICRAGRSPLSADGVAIVGDPTRMHPEVLAASGDIGYLFAEVQEALGEGPAHEAAERQAVIVVEDLREQAPVAWPLLADRMRRLGIGSIASLPLAVEGTRLGVLHLLRSAAGQWDELAVAEVLAELAADALLYQDSGIAESELERLMGLDPATRASLHRAMSMLWHARRCSPGRALAILHERAALARLPLADFAAMVASGDLPFE